jgi:hypothetical protein
VSRQIRLRTVVAILFVALPFEALAQASADNQSEQIRAQVEELEARLNDLEHRLARIERNSKDSSALPSAALSPEKQRWRGLSKSMGREGVRRLLGEPVRIDGGSLEQWYYSNRNGGPSVTFYEGKVFSWREP